MKKDIVGTIKDSFVTDKKAGKVGLHRATGYGLVDWFISGSGGMIGASLMFFYTTFAGISPAIATTIIVTGRLIFDAIVSPLIGRFSDNFYRTKLGKRFGRRRFFLLIGSPLCLSFALLWVTGANFLYYVVTLVLFETVFSLITIPWETLPTEMTEDYNQRTKMGTMRMWIAGFSTSVITIIPAALMKELGDDNPLAYLYTGIFYAICGVVFVFIAYLSTWEKDYHTLDQTVPEVKETALHSFIDTFKNVGTTLRIKTFRKHLVLYFCTYGAIDAFNTIFLYFGTYSLAAAGMKTSDSYIMMSLSIVGLFLAPILGALFIKIGPRPLYTFGVLTGLVAMLGYGYLYIAQDALGQERVWIIIIAITFFFQLGRSVIGFLPWNVFPFIPDLDEIVSKEKRSGTFAGVMTFFRKASMVLVTVIIGAVLQAGGLITDKIDGKMPTPEQQPASAGAYIAGLLVFLVGGLFLLLLWNALTFKLNKKTHAILIAETERLRSGGSKADVTPETRKVVEELIGLDYDEWVWTGR